MLAQRRDPGVGEQAEARREVEEVDVGGVGAEAGLLGRDDDDLPGGADDSEIVFPAIYGGTLHLLQDLLSRFGAKI